MDEKTRKEKLARNQRLRTARRVEAGVCIECEKPATRGQRCNDCADANIARVRRSLAKKIKP